MDETNRHIRALHGDIFVCLKELQDLMQLQITTDIAGHLSQVIETYRSNIFVSIEYAESLLSNVGKLIETGQNNLVFSRCSEFIKQMICIVYDFSRSFCHKETITSSFSSHFCYELALYILLGLIEKSELMKHFLQVVDDNLLAKLVVGISSVLANDLLYLTQELGLEIVARCCYSVSKERASTLRQLLKSFPLDIVRVLEGNKSEIVGLLRDMRPLLNKINHSNCCLFSALIVELSWKQNNVAKSYALNSWVDFCAEYICFQVKNLESFVRFSYKSVSGVRFIEQDLTLQLTVKALPSKILEIFQTCGSESTKTESQLLFRFSNKEDYSGCKTFLSSRMLELEIPYERTTESNSKMSVVSSKLLSENQSSLIYSEELAQTTDAQETISTLSSPPMVDKEEFNVPNIHLTRGLKQLNKGVVDSLAAVNPSFSEIQPSLKKKKGRPRKRNNSSTVLAQRLDTQAQLIDEIYEQELSPKVKEVIVDFDDIESKFSNGKVLSSHVKIHTEAMLDKENIINTQEINDSKLQNISSVKRPLEMGSVQQEQHGKKLKIEEPVVVEAVQQVVENRNVTDGTDKLHEAVLSVESEIEDSNNYSPIVCRSSSNEDDDEIISTLMAEIVSMQKQRTLRKCKRLLSSHIQTAELQLTNFINQWFNFAHYLCNDFDHNNSLRLNVSQTTLNSVFTNFEELFVVLNNIEKVLSVYAHESFCEISTFVAECKNYSEQKAKENSAIKKEIQKLKRLLTNRCRQSLHQHIDANRNFLQKEEFMKALEKL